MYFLRLFYLQEQQQRQQKNPETQENLLPHQTKKPRSTLALDMI